jgi:hypothetical protein
MERASEFFGGVTEVDVFDNMKTVVIERTPMGAVFDRRSWTTRETEDSWPLHATSPGGTRFRVKFYRNSYSVRPDPRTWAQLFRDSSWVGSHWSPSYERGKVMNGS